MKIKFAMNTSQCGAKYTSYNDLLKIKLVSRSMNFNKKWLFGIAKSFKIILCEYQVGLPIRMFEWQWSNE